MPEGAVHATWWDLARRLGSLRRLVVPVDPTIPQLSFDPGLVWDPPERSARWLRWARKRLDSSAAMFDSMLALSRGPAALFPPIPDVIDDVSVRPMVLVHDCMRALRADAAHQFEQGHHGACVERIEAMVGLSRHCLRQDDTMWVLKGSQFLRSVLQAIRVFDAAVRRAPVERLALRSSLVMIEELDRSPWPVLLGLDIESRRMHPDLEWPEDALAATVRHELRSTIAGIDEMGA